MTTNYHKEFNKILGELSKSKWRIDAFRDFLVMAHISLANTVYHSKELEEDYLEVAKNYNDDELKKFSRMLALTTMALTEKHQDFLGESFMGNEMGNSYKGQFFTPYNISSFMSQISLGSIEETIKEKGWFSLSEPACGSGGIVIACDEIVTKSGYKSFEVMCVQAQDIDNLCFMMSYIQLSILDIPAKVILGDTLRMTQSKVLYTPSFIKNNWTAKIAKYETSNEVDEELKEAV